MSRIERERALREAVRRAAAGGSGAHPPAEELAAYQRRALDEQAAEQVRAHLAACPECADLVLDLAAFPDLAPPAGDAPLSAAGLAERRARLARRLAAEEAGAGARQPAAGPRPLPVSQGDPVPAGGAAGASRWRSAPPLLYAAAAGLLVAVAVLAAWGAGQRGAVLRAEAELARRTAGAGAGSQAGAGGAPMQPWVVQVVPADRVRRGGAPAEREYPPAWAERVVVVMPLDEAVDRPVYGLRIVDASGAVVHRVEGLRRDAAQGWVSAQWPAGTLGAGDYTLVLTGNDGEAVERYLLRLAGPAAP